MPTHIVSTLSTSIHSSLLQLQHLASGLGGFLHLLSTPGVGQVLGVNTFPFRSSQPMTYGSWWLNTHFTAFLVG